MCPIRKGFERYDGTWAYGFTPVGFKGLILGLEAWEAVKSPGEDLSGLITGVGTMAIMLDSL
jgi:hypothetical protein